MHGEALKLVKHC